MRNYTYRQDWRRRPQRKLVLVGYVHHSAMVAGGGVVHQHHKAPHGKRHIALYKKVS